MTVTQQLADALRAAEDALASSYQVVDFPANGASPQDAALAKVRQALTAYEASRAAPDDVVVEAVAKAIYEGGIPKGARDYVAWEDLDSEGFYAQHDLAMKQARAALSALPARDEGLEALRELMREKSQGDAVYYLGSNQRQLNDLQELVTTSESFYGPTISTEILADNLDWLDCFIDSAKAARNKLAATERGEG